MLTLALAHRLEDAGEHTTAGVYFFGEMSVILESILSVHLASIRCPCLSICVSVSQS